MLKDQNTSVKMYLVKGMALAALLVTIKLLFEQTLLGQSIQQGNYNFLMSRLGGEENLSIVILDISSLRHIPKLIDNQQVDYTPRPPLKQIIQSVINKRPIAIGVDIDFSPFESEPVTKEDFSFFQFCKDLSDQKSIPIFLGVYRMHNLPKYAWLGSRKYASLAASIIVTHTPNQEVEKMPLWTQVRGSKERYPTMSTALANTVQEHVPEPPDYIRWAVELSPIRHPSSDTAVSEYLINYNPLHVLQRDKFRSINPICIDDQGFRFSNKIVLIGNGTITGPDDLFFVPGIRSSIPGIYLHACAIYTLLTGPIYEPTWIGKLLLDIFLSALVLISVALIKVVYNRKSSVRVREHKLEQFLTFLIALIAFIIGVDLVRFTRLMWDDFMLVIPVLIFHPSAERQLKAVWEWISKQWQAEFEEGGDP